MTELVRGLDSRAAAQIRSALEQVVLGRPVPDDLDPRLRAFARVAELPSRQRCALLPWEALDEALGSRLVR